MTKHRAQCARGTNVDTIGKKYIWKLIWWLYVSSFYLTLKKTLKPRMPAFCSTWYVKVLANCDQNINIVLICIILSIFWSKGCANVSSIHKFVMHIESEVNTYQKKLTVKWVPTRIWLKSEGKWLGWPLLSSYLAYPFC